MGHQATLFAVAAAFCFGVALVITQFGLRHTHPLTGALISIVSTASLFWLLSPLCLDTGAWNPYATAIFAGIGCLFPAAVTVLTFAANQRMGPTIAGAVGGTAPFFAIAGAALLLGERVSLHVIVGALVILGGVTSLTWREKRSSQRWPLVLPVAAAAIRGLAQTFTKYGLALWANPFAAGLIGYTASSVTVSLAARFGGPRRAANDRRGIAWFVLVGFCNGAAVLSMFVALSRGRVGLVAPIVATYPLFTLLASSLFLRRERFTPAIVGGVLATVTGVVILVVD